MRLGDNLEKIYCDTCIYLDYFYKRKTERGRDVGKEALIVFNSVLKGQYKLVVSNWVLEELKFYNCEEFQNLEKFLSNNMIYIKYSDQDMIKAKKFNNWKDALHVILAEKTGSDYLITQNIQDFILFDTKIKLIQPSYLFFLEDL
jgi:predicted nucleic acid-binding protein